MEITNIISFFWSRSGFPSLQDLHVGNHRDVQAQNTFCSFQEIVSWPFFKFKIRKQYNLICIPLVPNDPPHLTEFIVIPINLNLKEFQCLAHLSGCNLWELGNVPSGGFTAFEVHVQPTMEARRRKKGKCRGRRRSGFKEQVSWTHTDKNYISKSSILTCMIGTYTADNPGSQPKDISSITGQSLHKDKTFLSNFCTVLDTNRFFLKTEVMSGFSLHLF